MSSSDSQGSDGVYNTPLELHPHLRNGGRSCLEIEVMFHDSDTASLGRSVLIILV